MSKINKKARHELLVAVSDRYRIAEKRDKSRILSEFVALTGYHPKHAIRILNRPPTSARVRGARKSRVYNEGVKQALVVLWEASDRVCGKRLKALLPVLVDSLERHGHLHLDQAVRSLVLAASAATIDRALAEPRARQPGRRKARAKPLVRKQIQVRTFADWREPDPGYMEIDLVAHCGGSLSGSFAHTLTLTDVASGWTEGVPLLVREGSLVVEAIARLQPCLPFALKGIDSDNGGGNSSTRCWSSTASSRASSSPEAGHTERTTRHGSSRRMDRLSVGWSATVGLKALAPSKPSRVYTGSHASL